MTVRQQSSPAGLGNEPCTELLASVPCSWGWCLQGFPGSCCRQAAVLARELLQTSCLCRAAAAGNGIQQPGPAWVFLTSTFILLKFVLGSSDFMTWLAG